MAESRAVEATQQLVEPDVTTDEEAVPPHLRWALRLLISVDLVGSTALKHRGGTEPLDEVRWVHWFTGFYEAFPDHLRAQYEKLPAPVRSFDHKPEGPPTLWKRNGDELLLHVRLEHHREALFHLVALRQALMTFREQWVSKLSGGSTVAAEARSREFPMDLKATAWVAGFPITNVGVPLDEPRPADFIGPQVDLGFRLAKYAARDRIVLDLGLALLLATAMEGIGNLDDCPLVYYDDQELKGILDGLPYPLLAVNVRHPLEQAARALASTPGPRVPEQPANVAEFAEQFIRHSHGLVYPFIHGDPEFGLDPRRHGRLESKRQELIDDYQAATGDIRGTPPDAPRTETVADFTTLHAQDCTEPAPDR